MPEDAGPRSRETAWLLGAGAALAASSALFCLRALAYAINIPVSRDEPSLVSLYGGAKFGYEFSLVDRVELFAQENQGLIEVGITATLAVVAVVVARPATRRHVRVALATLLAVETFLLFVLPAEVMQMVRHGTRARVNPGETWFWSYLDEMGPTVSGVLACALALVLTGCAFGVVLPRRPQPEPEPVPVRSPFAAPDLDEEGLPSYVS